MRINSPRHRKSPIISLKNTFSWDRNILAFFLGWHWTYAKPIFWQVNDIHFRTEQTWPNTKCQTATTVCTFAKIRMHQTLDLFGTRTSFAYITLYAIYVHIVHIACAVLDRCPLCITAKLNIECCRVILYIFDIYLLVHSKAKTALVCDFYAEYVWHGERVRAYSWDLYRWNITALSKQCIMSALRLWENASDRECAFSTFYIRAQHMGQWWYVNV